MGKEAILCVDDEKTVLETLQQQLRSIFGQRYDYEIAESGWEAFEAIEELREDGYVLRLVITDWQMPGVNGGQFLDMLNREDPNLPTVLLTGQAPDRSVREAFEHAGLNAFLAKPWEPEELKTTVEGLLQAP